VISFGVAQIVDARRHRPIEFTKPVRAWQEGTPMMRLGLMLSISSIVTLLVGYGIQLFISGVGGLTQVGLYNAGFLILNTYVGLIFTAMGTDYFPRLSAVGEDLDKTRTIVGNQAEMATLLMLPVIVVFLALAPWIITLLYTAEFEAVVPLVRWGILGMLFKAVSFSLGYVIIARGDSKLFLRTTLSFNVLLFTINAIGYYYWGLSGLGVSFLIYYIIHFFSLIAIVRWRYGLTLSTSLYAIFSVGLILCLLVLFSSIVAASAFQIALTAVLIIITCLFSLYRLNQRIDLIDMLRRKKDKDSDEH
jgi:O-antigen/teichoic acid export membrane protein